MDLPRPRPSRVVLDGRYARLEPLALSHAEGLLAASADPKSFDYLFDVPPRDLADLRAWIARCSVMEDQIYSTVIDKASAKVGGRQALMRIVPEHGVIEIGNILWGPAIARTRVASEALFLAARYVFDELGYRRFEWKCNNLNEPSKAAAKRFGFTFEGVFRQHMWSKGKNRDTAWFAMIDKEWPSIRNSYEFWLDPSNFYSDGCQRSKLQVRSS